MKNAGGAALRKLPLRRFSLQIFLEHKKLADFHHRLPLSILTHVYIAGDVRLQALAWEGNYYVSGLFDGALERDMVD